MTDGVRPIPGIPPVDRRTDDRRSGQRRTLKEPGKALVVTEAPIDQAETAERATTARDVAAAPASAFAAQLMGQGGQRKGIRGGPTLMDAARSTYLGAEYSGEMDRRPPLGKTGKTDV